MNAGNPSEPCSYPRRVLLAVIGISPQVVTETVNALAIAQKPAFAPTEVHVLTTTHSHAKAVSILLRAEPAWFRRLLAD